MIDIPKGLAQFLARDLVFMAGGSGVTASFLHWLDRLPDKETPAPYFFLALGVSYAVGFALQESFTAIGLVTTRNVYKPRRILKWLFRRYDHLAWRDSISQTDDAQLRRFFQDTEQSEQWWATHQRIITHMMIGTTLAPCALVSAILLLKKSWPVFGRCLETEARAMGLACLALALLLWPFGWLKAMQKTVREVQQFEANSAKVGHV